LISWKNLDWKHRQSSVDDIKKYLSSPCQSIHEKNVNKSNSLRSDPTFKNRYYYPSTVQLHVHRNVIIILMHTGPAVFFANASIVPVHILVIHSHTMPFCNHLK
jgi:hypothetical protein